MGDANDRGLISPSDSELEALASLSDPSLTCADDKLGPAGTTLARFPAYCVFTRFCCQCPATRTDVPAGVTTASADRTQVKKKHAHKKVSHHRYCQWHNTSIFLQEKRTNLKNAPAGSETDVGLVFADTVPSKLTAEKPPPKPPVATCS